MRKVFVALALVAIIVSATMLPEVRERAQSSLSKLKKTRMGKNVITAIQLEMSSKNQENIVVRIIALLNELLNQSSESLSQAQADLAAKEDYCGSTSESYQSQIDSKNADIANAESELPVLQAQLDSDNANLVDQQGKLDAANQALNQANELNGFAISIFDVSIANHNNMIEALKEARALIVQLQSSSFLQKNNAVLIQMKNHRESAMKKISSHTHKSLFSLLMQMAQDVGIQADQQLVGNVIDVIDDLLQHEQDGVDAETAAENERVAEYNAQVEDLNNQINNATQAIADLEADIQKVSNDIADTENNIATWNQQVSDLQALLDDLNAQCTADIAHFNDVITDLNDQIDVIQQVIAIFEGQAIQDIKPLVDNIPDDDESAAADADSGSASESSD